MSEAIQITFDCLPLRSIGRFDAPLDAPAESIELARRIRLAAVKHGTHNAYYLHHAQCVFQLTNDPAIGMVEFGFEGTVLTDADDLRTIECDLSVDLRRETCDWLTGEAVAWLSETVRRAVQAEFDRYIAAGDLRRTIERIERLQAESDARGGFLGMGL